MQPPPERRWLFWEVDASRIDLEAHADYVLARVLEHGTLDDVRWAIATYGLDGIRRFFREVGHPEMSDRTVGFWRAVLHAENERWATPPDWRRSSSAPWID